MIHKFHRRRLLIFFGLMAMVYGVIVVRLFQVQVVQRDVWTHLDMQERQRKIPIVPRRGKILSCNGKELASSVPCYSLCADPAVCADLTAGDRVPRIAQGLGAILNIAPEIIEHRLRPPRPALGPTNDATPNSEGAWPPAEETHARSASPSTLSTASLAERLIPKVLTAPPANLGEEVPHVRGYPRFVWIKRKIDPREEEAVRRLLSQHRATFRGVMLKKEYKRVYPNNQLLAQVLGFVGSDDEGMEGLEHRLNSVLGGTPGERVITAGPKGMEVPHRNVVTRRPEGYYDVTLTIDEVIQYYVERELDQVVAKYTPKSAFALVMDPNTGEVLAMASRPTYDPNTPEEFDPETWRNQPITDTYEPGSVFKMVTAAAALEDQKVDPATTFNCPGKIVLWDIPIHCTAVHGDVSLPHIIEHSCNVGMIKVALVVGPKNLYYYIRKFGFGQKTGIDLPGEAEGHIRPPEQWSGTSIGALAIGQEVAVTGIQIAAAIGAIANGGRLLRPQIIKRIDDPATGKVIKDFSLDLRYRVISPEVCRKLTSYMTLVTKSGTGVRAALDDYQVAGKTGTSEKLGRAKEEKQEKYVSSFIGFLPANDPKILAYIVLNEPHGEVLHGGVVAGPAFREIAKQVMLLRKVPPEVGVGTPVQRPSAPPPPPVAAAPARGPSDDSRDDSSDDDTDTNDDSTSEGDTSVDASASTSGTAGQSPGN